MASEVQQSFKCLYETYRLRFKVTKNMAKSNAAVGDSGFLCPLLVGSRLHFYFYVDVSIPFVTKKGYGNIHINFDAKV